MTLALDCQYSEAIETQMQEFHRSLGEKDRRRYAAMEAVKLPHGGIRYVASVLGCSENTISAGIKELKTLGDGDPLAGRERAKGGGRPKKNEAVRSSLTSSGR